MQLSVDDPKPTPSCKNKRNVGKSIPSILLNHLECVIWYGCGIAQDVTLSEELFVNGRKMGLPL